MFTRTVHPSISHLLVCRASQPLLYKEACLACLFVRSRTAALGSRALSRFAVLSSALLLSRPAHLSSVLSLCLAFSVCSSSASPFLSSRRSTRLFIITRLLFRAIADVRVTRRILCLYAVRGMRLIQIWSLICSFNTQ